jgi:hypothetical protein
LSFFGRQINSFITTAIGSSIQSLNMSSQRRHQQRGSRPALVEQTSATGRPGLKAPKPEPGILTSDGRTANLAEFRENRDVEARKTYPLTYKIINNPDAFLDIEPIESIADIIDKVKAENLSDNVERAMLSDRTRRTAEARDFRKEEITHYGALFDKLSEFSQYRVKSHKDFQSFHDECDLSRLWKAIIDTHSVGADASDSAVPRLTEEDMHKCRQGTYESSLEFHRRLTERSNAMDAITRASTKEKIEQNYTLAMQLVPEPDIELDNPPTKEQVAAVTAAAKATKATKTYLTRKRVDDLKASLHAVYKSPAELAEIFMARLDPTRFGELYTSILNDDIKGIDSMPTDLEAALTLARKWKVSTVKTGATGTQTVLMVTADDYRPTAPKPKREKKKDKSVLSLAAAAAGKQKFDGSCFWCARPGHREADCKSKAAGKPKKTESSPATAQATQCTKCNRKGHIAADCYAKTVVSAMGEAETPTAAAGGSTQTYFSLVTVTDILSLGASPGTIPDHLLVLDTGSMVNVIKSRDLLTDIHTGGPTHLSGINGSTRTMSQYGTAGHYGESLFNPESIANIVSLNSLGADDQVEFAQGPDPHFKITWADGTTHEFPKHKSGLYALDTRTL